MSTRVIASWGGTFLGSTTATGWFLGVDDTNGNFVVELIWPSGSQRFADTTVDMRAHGWYAVALSVTPGTTFSEIALFENEARASTAGGTVQYGEDPGGYDVANTLIVGGDIGTWASGGFSNVAWPGRIERVAYWQEHLSDTPLAYLTGHNPGNTPGMTATTWDNNVAQGNNVGGSGGADPPYLYWKFQEGPGATTAVDAEGHVNGTIHGGGAGVTLGVADDWFTQPPVVTDFDFDGSGNGYVTSASVIQGGTRQVGYGRDFTLAALVRVGEPAPTTKVAVGRMVT